MLVQQHTCKNCGGDLKFSPGARSLTCPFCGTVNEIESASPVAFQKELDYQAYLDKFAEKAQTQEVRTTTCGGCGAEVSFGTNETTAQCIYCGTEVVATGESHKAMPPQYLVPFVLPKSEAEDSFKGWLKKLWFAPSKLKKMARRSEALVGIYFPFWTFDAKTESDYTGERGTDYTVEEKTTDSNGEPTTRRVTKTRWDPASGHVSRDFDDMLITASSSLPPRLATRLDKWDLSQLHEYDEQYLAGFRAETYSKGLKDSFSEAKSEMEDVIEQDVRRDIGGDHQRVHSVDTSFSAVTFKYILLPVWSFAYTFKGKAYQVLVNAQTGEVEAERPWSWVKIAAAVLAVAAVAIGGYFAVQYFGG